MIPEVGAELGHEAQVMDSRQAESQTVIYLHEMVQVTEGITAAKEAVAERGNRPVGLDVAAI